MSDTTLNAFVGSGTAADMAGFTPSPPIPASGPSPGYFFFQTDTGEVYSWDDGGGVWVLVNLAEAADQTIVANITGGSAPAVAVAAASVSAYALISEVTTAASQASVSFTSIPATYRDLLVVVRGRSNVAATTDDVLLQFNADTAANYDREVFKYVNATLTAAGAVAQTSILVGSISGSTATAGRRGAIEAHILDYRGTTFDKQVITEFSFCAGTAAGDQGVGKNGGNWRSTAAVTQTDVFPAGGTWNDDSIVSLYGRW